MDRAYGAGLQEQLAENRIHLLTTAPASAPVPLVKELNALGILTGAGCDGIRDTLGAVWQFRFAGKGHADRAAQQPTP